MRPLTSVWAPIRKLLSRQRLANRKLGFWHRPPLYAGLVILALVIALVMWNREKIFTLDVSTEVVAFTINDPILSEWSLGPTRLIECREEPEGRPIADQSLLIIDRGTHVRVQRHGIEAVRIQLTVSRPYGGSERPAPNGSSEGRPVGHIEQPNGPRINLHDPALLLVKLSGRPLVFPFRGILTAGDDVAVGVDSILLDGTVSVVEEQLLGKTHYVAGGETLNPGDRVRLWHSRPWWMFWQQPARTPTTVSGFVRAEAEDFSEAVNALSLVAHAQADYVEVLRLGSAGYDIRAPRWARFLHDPLLAAGTAMVALVALLLELSSKIGSLIEKQRDDRLNIPRRTPRQRTQGSNQSSQGRPKY